jgi:cytochrome P450
MSEPLVYDPYSYEIDRDPYPVYRRMRDEAPVYRNERLDFWALTRFDDVLAALRDWERFSSAEGTVLELMGQPGLGGTMIIFMDPPRQTRVRNLVSKAFTPARVAALEPEIRRIARRHLDALAGRPRFDVVAEFTAKLPMDVISALLGIPPEDRDAVRGWSNQVLHREPDDPMPPPMALEAMAKSQAYYAEALAARRRAPRDDLMTLLVEAEVEEPGGGRTRLSDDELRSFFMLLGTAGNETVTKLLATLLYELWRHPDDRALLVREPRRIPDAVEEALRYDPPSQYQGRTLTRDVELHGTTMPKGGRVLLVNGATGRDERRFEDPERFSVLRRVDQHLAFGHGRHVCLGASLARLEMRVAMEELLARHPEYEIPADGTTRIHSSNVRGFASMHLELPS